MRCAPRRPCPVGPLLAACLLSCTVPGTAAVITVMPDGSGDVPTIQAALAAAAAGDVVELGDGLYTGPGNADFFQWIGFPEQGDTVTIRSASGDPELCVIDGGGQSTFHVDGRITLIVSGVQFQGLDFMTGDMGPSPNPHVELRVTDVVFRETAVDLLFLTDGRFEDVVFERTGVFASYMASFTGCRFAGHHNADSGGAILAWGGLTVTGCYFVGNSAAVQGGAICQTGDSFAADTRITDSVFESNEAGASGGAICMAAGLNEPPANLVVTGCTFHRNSAPLGSSVTAAGAAAMARCLVVAGLGGEALACIGEGAFELACCDLYGNAGGDWVGCVAAQRDLAGNVAADPCFCAPDIGNITLCADSWCLPGLPPEGCPGLRGARGAGCRSCECEAPVPAAGRSWGDVRALYR